jgi:hypothetical protein
VEIAIVEIAMQLDRSFLIVTALASAYVMFASPRASAAQIRPPSNPFDESYVTPIYNPAQRPKHLKCIPDGCHAGYLHCHCYFVR